MIEDDDLIFEIPLESGDFYLRKGRRKMMMAFMIVPARLVKLKRLVDNLYVKEEKDV